MIESNYLFVYGTLRKGFRNIYAERLHDESEYIGTGYAFGDLYQLDGYPGFVPSNENKRRVYGDIFLLNNYEDQILRLDYYEGASKQFKEPREYYRKIIPVYVGEKTYNCWIYIYNWTVENAPIVRGGDYLTFSNH